MPRAGAPEWRRRKEPVLDHLLIASVSQVNGVHNAEGHYGELVYAGCESKTRADEIKRALYRAGKHTGHSVHAKVEKHGSEWQVRFKAIDKTMARKYMLSHYGDDRTKWPYSPWRHDPNFDAEVFRETDG